MTPFTLVVTGAPEEQHLETSHANAISLYLHGPSPVRSLAQGKAYELDCSFPSRSLPDFESCSAPDHRPVPADYNLVTPTNRRKKLLVADMESTIIEQECLDELAEYVGLRDRVAEITERAMRGELDFEDALRERVRLLAGLSVDHLEELYESRISSMSGAETLVRTMSANGAHCALVSGGFTWFTSRIAEQLGFHSHQANELIIEDGKLTGEVASPILGRAAKKQALERLSGELNIDLADAICVGDGANDLDMLTSVGEAGGIGVAYHAKPVVAQTAPHRIDHGDLTALLYLQGYRRSDFNNGP